MRAHAPTNSRASGLARARMLMKARLWWLSGYPTAEGWVVVPAAGGRGVETLQLDREHLSRGTYTANKLRGEFPRAMPTLVGDVDAWHAGVHDVFTLLKPWVHRGDRPPSELLSHGLFSRGAVSAAESLVATHRSLRPMVSALSWVLATRPSLFPDYLKWVSREADALIVLHEQRPQHEAVRFGVRCAHLAMLVGPKAATAMAHLVGASATYSVAVTGGGPYMREAKRLFRPGGHTYSVSAVPEPQLVTHMEGWVDWLLSVDRPTAKRFLELLRLCDLRPLLRSWEQWWPAATQSVAKVIRIQAHVEESRAKHDRLGRLRLGHTALIETQPPHLDLEGVGRTLRTASGDAFADCYPSATRILASVTDPARSAVRFGLLFRWVHVRTHDAWWNPRWLPSVLDSMAQFFAAIPEHEAVTPWAADTLRAAGSGRWSQGLLDELVDDDDLVHADIPRFFAVLAYLREHESSRDLSTSGSLVITLLEAFHDAELVARLVEPMVRADEHQGWHSRALLRAAWQIADPDPEVFPALVVALRELGDGTEADVPALVKALRSALGEDRDVLHLLLFGEDKGALLSCGRKLAALQALGALVLPEPPLMDAAADWVEEYPAAFHDDLIWLSRLTPRAQVIGSKVLRSVHQGREAIASELEAVRSLASEAAGERERVLRERCATLEARLEAPPVAPSAAKLDKLQADLRRRGGLALLTTIEQKAEDSLRKHIAEHFGLELSTPWLLDGRLLHLLAPLQKLSASTRQLAKTLLQSRASKAPWDLREHPANAEFLASLRRMSIDPAPWVDGIDAVPINLAGRPVQLSLEDDPLEVFHMGRHFGTCLSPGQCNFFSVFANAADINKRVLYARSATGQVLGRRLICVTREGKLMAFHAYAHDDSSRFEEHSTAFVLRLAVAMGTSVVGRGTVSKLVADDWYDDGPVDITGQYESLTEGSPFRAALSSISPDRLPALLAETFGDAKLDEGLAPMLLALREFSDRPELVVSLLPLLRHADRLPLRMALLAGEMLARVGSLARAGALFAAAMAKGLWLSYREHRWLDHEVLAFLARCSPSRALQILRRTRERGVRGWDGEHDCGRLLAAATAMEALHRPAQAIRMCRRVLDVSHGTDRGQCAEAERRLAALEAQYSR